MLYYVILQIYNSQCLRNIQTNMIAIVKDFHAFYWSEFAVKRLLS